jgi:hypothetical protein
MSPLPAEEDEAAARWEARHHSRRAMSLHTQGDIDGALPG